MKRLVFITVIISLLAGCAALPDSLSFLSPTQTSSPALTPTPFGLPATFTPDLFVINTQAPTTTLPAGAPIATSTPFPTRTTTSRPTITLEPLDVNLFTPSANIFVAVQRSANQLVWGYNCDGARSIKFIVTINKPKRLKYVLLFVRLQDKYSGNRTEWGAGAIMDDNDRGAYFYTLYLDQIADYKSFEDAWLQYQFVGSTIGLTVLGRSVVSRNEVSLTSCRAINQ